MKLLISSCAIMLIASAMPAVACDCRCGDANCDGRLDVGDGAAIMNYLYNGWAPPMDADIECANWDYRLTLTIGDVLGNIAWVFWGSGGPPPETCPPAGPPIAPAVDSTSILYYTDYIPSGADAGIIALTLRKEFETSAFGMSFPIRVRIDGEIPIIDSVVIADGIQLDGAMIYDETGDVAIGIVPISGNSAWMAKQLAFIYVSVPPEPFEHTVAIEWVNLTPVQAPTQDSSVIPMILNDFVVGVEPLLQPHCCLVPGDANMDGEVNVGDAIYIINCVFKDCLGHDCESQLDANCDGTWNVGDAVFLINRIFRGGPEPCCI